MGNQQFYDAAQHFRDRDDVPDRVQMSIQALEADDEELLDQLWRTMYNKLDLEQLDGISLEKAVPNNMQTNEAEDQDLFNVERILNGINTESQSGFKNPECHIQDLQDPAHVKYFTVLKNHGKQELVNKAQQKKTRILYALYLMKMRSNDDTFQQYFSACLRREMNNSRDTSGMDGLSFVTFILQQMRGLPEVLHDAMEKIIESLQKMEPGDQKHSFAQDQNLDNNRKVFIELIHEEDGQLACLAYRVLILLGLARSSVEDLLIISKLLLNEDRPEIDLRDEIQRLKTYYEKQAQDAKSLEEQAKVSKEDFDPGELRIIIDQDMNMAQHEIKRYQPQLGKNGWVCDGDFFYAVSSEYGIVKLSTGSHGRMPGKQIAWNSRITAFPIAYCEGSLMLLNGKLYLRQKESEKAPFIIIDKDTLQVIEADPDQDLSLQEGQTHSLHWKETDEETGRALTYTPMITDGQYVYVIARQFESKKEKAERKDEGEAPEAYLVVEVYDPAKNFQFVRKITLCLKDNEKYKNGGRYHDSEVFVRNTQWATNGTHLVHFFSLNQIRIFDLETGMELETKYFDHDFEEFCYTYNHQQGTFFYIHEQNGILKYKMFKFEKCMEKSLGRKKVWAKLLRKVTQEIEEAKKNSDPIEFDAFDKVMSKYSTTEITEVKDLSVQLKLLSSEQVNKMVRAMIYKLLNLQVKHFNKDLSVKKLSGRNEDVVMSIYKYPFVTNVTRTTFQEITTDLNYHHKLLSEATSLQDHELENFLATLKILRANLQALDFCRISLNSILMKEQEFKDFVNLFKEGYIFLYSKGTQEQQLISNEYQKDLWIKVQQVCEDITLVNTGTSEDILNDLNSKIEKGQMEECELLLTQMTEAQHLKAIINSNMTVANSKFDLLVQIYLKVCAFSSTLLGRKIEMMNVNRQIVSGQNTKKTDDKLILATEEFLVKVAEELMYQYSVKCEDYEALLRNKIEGEVIKPPDPKTEKFAEAIWEISEVVLQELVSIFKGIFDELENSVKDKETDEDFTKMGTNFFAYEQTICGYLNQHAALSQITMMLTSTYGLFKNPENVWTLKLFQGCKKLIDQLSRFYTFWKKYGDKIGDGSRSSFEEVVDKLNLHLTWHYGMMGYQLILIEPEAEPDKEKEDDSEEVKKAKGIKAHRLQLLQNVSKSNLLSGGIEPKYLRIFSDKTKEDLRVMATLMQDSTMLNQLRDDAGSKGDDDDFLEALIYEGKNKDTDYLIKAIHNIQRTGLKIEGSAVTFKQDLGGSAYGGANGMMLTRAAFAVMIKFSDLTEDLQAIQENVKSIDDPKVIKETIAFATGAEEILNCWKSASQMRPWLQERKNQRSEKWTKRLMTQAEESKKELAKKRKEEENEKKKAQAKKEKDDDQIKDAEEDKIDESELALTEDEKNKVNDDAYDKSIEDLDIIIKKVIEKAAFLLKLNIPQTFKKEDKTLLKGKGGLQFIQAIIRQTVEERISNKKMDWQSRLKLNIKHWKDNQLKKGAITSLNQEKKEIWSSGLTAVKALLQTSVEYDKIQENVESIYLKASKRCAGFKMIQSILNNNMPKDQQNHLIDWFCAALRQNTNKLSHYLDELMGQGTQLETLSNKFFFQIIKIIVNRLKNAEDEDDIKFLLNSLKWSYTARDHQQLVSLGLFGILHKGSNDQKSLLKKAWGRSLKLKSLNIEDQNMSEDVIQTFEQLFLTVTSRVVTKEETEQINNKEGGSPMPKFQRYLSFLDSDSSSILIGQAFEIIFQEFERYSEILMSYEGIDWDTFVRKRNEDRYEHQNLLQNLENEEGLLLDEVEDINEIELNEEDEKADDAEKDKAEGEEEKSPEELEQMKKEEEQKKKEEKEKKLRDTVIKTTKKIEKNQFKRLTQLYQENYLIRLLNMVEMFTSIAECSAQPQDMVKKVANPQNVSSLINILLICSPRLKIIVMKILLHIFKIKIPFEVFEEAVDLLKRDPSSMVNRILNDVSPQITFEGSLFVKLLYNYVLIMRSKMWNNREPGSEGQYAVTLSVTDLIMQMNLLEGSNWSHHIKEGITTALLKSDTVPLQEFDVIMSLLPGGEYGGMTSGQAAITNNNETVTVLGYSANWKKIQDFKDQSSEEYMKILQDFKISSEFTDPKQKAITLFYDKNNKHRQDLLYLSPSQLRQINYLNKDECLKLAKESPLMESDIIKGLIALLKTEDPSLENSTEANIVDLQFKKCTILKVLHRQIEDLGEEFISFMIQENVFTDFVSYLYQEDKIPLSPADQKSCVMPLKWLEHKIQRIRKTAIQTVKSLSFEEDEIKAFTMSDKEILIKRTDPKTKKSLCTNVYISAAFNHHKVQANTEYQCVLAKELNQMGSIQGQVTNNSLVFMDYEELTKLEQRTLQILNKSEAIITYLPENNDQIDDLFERLVAVFKEDAEKPKRKRKGYPNILETIVFFLDKEDYPDFSQPINDVQYLENQVDQSEMTTKGTLGKLLGYLKQFAGVEEDDALYYLDPKNMNDMPAVIKQIQEGLKEKQKQEKEFKESMDNAKKEENAEEKENMIKVLEESEKERLDKRNEVISQKKKTIIEAQLAEEEEEKQQMEGNVNELNLFEEYTTDEEWWKNIEKEVEDKISKKMSSDQNENLDSKEKTDDQITNMLWQMKDSFNKNELQREHTKAISQLTSMQRKQCLNEILNIAKLEQFMPLLLTNETEQKRFARFLKLQFNSAVIKNLQINQKVDYSSIKKTLADIFEYCDQNEQLKDFTNYFFKHQIVTSGIKFIKENSKAKIDDFFSIENNAAKFVNPYMLIFISKYLCKKDSVLLRQTKNALTNLINVHLMLAIKFNSNLKLVRKLLKSVLNLLIYCEKHLQELAEVGEMKNIIQNKLVGLVTSKIFADYDTSQKLKEQQLIWTEIHLLINDLCERVNDEFEIKIEKTIEDSETIKKVKSQKDILKDNVKFELPLYRFHVQNCTDDQLESFYMKMGSNNPMFDVATRGYIHMPEVTKVKIKIKDTSEYIPWSMFSMTKSIDDDFKLKPCTKDAVEWDENEVYISYPEGGGSIISFGKNDDKRLGKEIEDGGDYNDPRVQQLDEAYIPEYFKPKRIFGGKQYTCILDDKNKMIETGYMRYTCSNEHYKNINNYPDEWNDVKDGDAVIMEGLKIMDIQISDHNAWALMSDNSLWYKGYNYGYAFPDNSDRENWTKLPNVQLDEGETIVSYTAGYRYFWWVTSQGKLWGRGTEFLEALGKNTTDQVIVSMPDEGLARRVWATKEEYNQVVYVEVEDKNGKKAIYSAGQSDCASLGQGQKDGNNVTDSRNNWNKIAWDHDDIHIVDIATWCYVTFAIDNRGKIWAWGKNDYCVMGFSELGQCYFKPTEVGPLNDLGFKAKKIRVNHSHAVIQFEDDNGKEMLYSVGIRDRSYLGISAKDWNGEENAKKKPFREIEAFKGQKVADFCVNENGTSVLVQAEKGGELKDLLYKHTLSDGSNVKGLLHFYKKDNDMFFVPQSEYEERKDELPDLCFAIKCPIEGIQEKEWPDLVALAADVLDGAAESLTHSQKDTTTDEPIEGPLYHTRYTINDQQIEVNHSYAEVIKDDKYSFNPQIFFRLNKPFKEGKELPPFDLTKYYKTLPPYHLDFLVIPDLTTKINKKLLEMTKDSWQKLQNDVKAFKSGCKKEVIDILDKQLKAQIMDNFDNMHEIKIEEHLSIDKDKFKDPELKEIPENIVKLMCNLYWAINVNAVPLLNFQCTTLKSYPNSVSSLIANNIDTILPTINNQIIQKEINKLPTEGSRSVRISRNKAARYQLTGKVDHEGKYTIFGQLFQQTLKDKDLNKSFQMNDQGDRFWSVEFAGEGSQDAGGPFREMITNVVSELETPTLPLLIKTVNNRMDNGFSRDCFTLNPDANSPTHKELLKFMGRFLGFSIRSGSATDWHFTPVFWKQLKGEKVVMGDFESFDQYALTAFKDMMNLAEIYPAEDFDMAVDDNFTTILSNQKQVDIMPGGEDIKLTHANHKQFIELSIQARLAEAKTQMEWLKEGVFEVIPQHIMSLMSWEQLEQRACGGHIETDALKQITEYESCNDSTQVIQWFWKMFEEFDQKHRKDYLKFCWGRSKLPTDLKNCQRHKLNLYQGLGSKSFPKSHTCFFTTDMPPYEDYDLMVERIIYAIETCGEIDDDGGANAEMDEPDDF